MIKFLVTNENSCCRRAAISSRLKRTFRMVILDGLYETELPERNIFLQLCISLSPLALRKHHKKTQSGCRRVRKVAIRIHITFVLKTVPVSCRLRVVCLIYFPYTAANWTLLCVSFSLLARPVLTTSRGMPIIYFCLHLSNHFRPVRDKSDVQLYILGRSVTVIFLPLPFVDFSVQANKDAEYSLYVILWTSWLHCA